MAAPTNRRRLTVSAAAGMLVLVAVATATTAVAAPSSVSVTLPTGEVLSVASTPVDARQDFEPDASGFVRLETLTWTLADAAGRPEVSGRLRGTLRLSGGDAPALAVNPATGRAWLVHGQGALAGDGLLLRAFTGWGFTAPAPLPVGDATARDPELAFLPAGDALVAWTTPGPVSPALRIQHAELSPSGADPVLAFVEVADVERLLRPAGEGVQLRPGLADVVVDGDRDTAFALVGGTDSASLGVLGMRVSVFDDIWGGSAAPVPVTVSSSSVHPLDDESGPVASWTVDFERLRLGDHDLIAWWDDGILYGVAARDGAVSPLLRVVSGGDADEAMTRLLRAAWREIARTDGERSGSSSRRSGGR